MSVHLSNDHNLKALRIDAPDWYAREDFRTWLNQPHTATWHHKGGQVGDFSDVFTTYDNGEGPDANADGVIPDDIWEFICKTCEKQNLSYAVIWITNIEMED